MRLNPIADTERKKTSMMARWPQDMDQVSLVASMLGSIRPSARPTLYHPVCTAFCGLVGVFLAAHSDNVLVAMIGFLFIPMNNWLAGIFFSVLAALGGWIQLFACAWGFTHFVLDAVVPAGPSVAQRALLRVHDRFGRQPRRSIWPD